MSESPELITGVMVPWLYVGSALSAFCWHLEDHGLCSVNYNHLGAPKVWYGVPANASDAVEDAVRDALPHLLEDCPDLMHQLVTMLSPNEMVKRGVPVVRAVQRAGEFIITLPSAYHCGFNAGFNVAEAVNFGPASWLPYGTDAVRKYRQEKRHCTFSHDALLLCIARAAITEAHMPGNHREGNGNSAGSVDAGDRPTRERRTPTRSGTSPGAASCSPGSRPAATVAEAPPTALAACLAIGEIAVRAREERRRIEVFEAALDRSDYERIKCSSRAQPGKRDREHGTLLDAADVDCVHCSSDLWLSAVVSTEAPEVATCPEHVDVLLRQHGVSRSSLVLLQRYTSGELDALVAQANELLPGVASALEHALERQESEETNRVRITPRGPLYDPSKLDDKGQMCFDAGISKDVGSADQGSGDEWHGNIAATEVVTDNKAKILHATIGPGGTLISA